MINAVSKDLNIQIIPNGVDGRRFNGVNKEKSNGVLKLICVGRLIERKGQIYLIRAARQLLDEGHEVQVDIVGTGHLEQYYTKQARDLELDGTVRFRGYVPREQIPACYNQADVFVLASFNEGMSVSTLEAMASSLPVVVTRTGGIHDLVKERENGFVFDYGDQDALVEHLRYFAQNPERIRLMGRKSRTVAEKFTWTEISQKYIKLFSMFDHR
jgi:glycosyltransferase involved in cell wall biosynthesis